VNTRCAAKPLGVQRQHGRQAAVHGVARGVAGAGCPPIPEIGGATRARWSRYLACPICREAKQIDKGNHLPNAEVGGTVVMWQWIGEEGATTFSY
jgi:hypothetical protein